ncbi:MAG: ABC transporter permease [Armatimonadota bacterium]|nr:ABC transporter permease [Armatimonadota bacterium]
MILAVLCALFAKLSPEFLGLDNLASMAQNFTEIGLIALPMTFVILTAGIDLSVGAIAGLSCVALGSAFGHFHGSFWAGAVAAVAMGALAGSLNGAAISWLGMPPLVVTLATMAIYRGLAVGFSGGEPVTGFPAGSEWLGQGMAGPFPHQAILLILLALMAAWALYLTPYGRYLYAIGGSEMTCRLGGVSVDAIRFSTYLLSGAAAGLAAVVYVSRVGTARSDTGAGWELDVISAVVLGGTDVAGGDGGLAGTILGLLIISVLRNGLNLVNFPQEGQPVILGCVLIGAIALDRLVRKRRS